MKQAIVVFNSGSTSLKFGAYGVDSALDSAADPTPALSLLCVGRIVSIAVVYAMTKFIGAYTAVLGGLDALVFTAGIGENWAPLRAASCRQLAWLGVKLDAHANDSGCPRISSADSGVSVWVIPTDEESMIAHYTLALVGPQAHTTTEART